MRSSCSLRPLVMASQVALFAETIAGMKKAVKRKAYGMTITPKSVEVC